MTKTKTGLFLIALFLFVGWAPSYAQCGTFTESGNKDKAETAHVLYRQAIKNKDFKKAFPNWKIAYDMAPAADGKRSTQYTDGVEIYKSLYAEEQDASKKAEYAAQISKIYDQMAECYPKEGSYAQGRKAYDLLYTVNAPREEILAAGKKAMELGGDKTEYIVFYPLTEAILYLFPLKKVTKEEARATYQKMIDIADHNIANNKAEAATWQKTKEDTKAAFVAIEEYIFDCDYFKAKLMPTYKADPENYELIKSTYTSLIHHGCAKSDPDLASLAAKYEAKAGAINAQRQAEFDANNPGVIARKLYKEGKYREAVAKYNEAISAESSGDKKAGHYFSIASIQGRKLGQYSKARANAIQAGKLRSGWGQPYMLIGDLYAKTSKNCGDAFNARLAIIAACDKWGHAKAIDSSVASQANKKINSYKKHFPEKGEAHMRGIQPGQSVKVKCWIGETVKMRIQ